MLCCDVHAMDVRALQGPGFSEQVAKLQSELRTLQQNHKLLTEDHKVGG